MQKGLQAVNLVACFVLGTAIACSVAVEIWSHVDLISTVQAQGNIKTVILDPPHSNDPIEVIKAEIGGKAAVRGTTSADDLKFWPSGFLRVAYRSPSDENWLRTLSFVLRNRTSEKIVSLDIYVLSPPDRMEMLSEISFGQLPAAMAYTTDGMPITPTGERIVFKPGEEMTFRLADDQRGFSRLIENPLSLTTSQVFALFRVYLEGGLCWMEYVWVKPDPDHPGQSLPTEGPYFPHSNLPGPHLRKPTQ
jgi:hypothetical protein